MNQGFDFPAEFHVDLPGADFDDDANAELRMVDTIARDEPFLHRIGAQRANLFSQGSGFFFRAPRRRASCCGFGGALTIDVIAVACATLDASDGAVGVDRGDDVFTSFFALSAIRVYVASDLRAFNDTERILHHYIDPVSIFDHPAKSGKIWQNPANPVKHSGLELWAEPEGANAYSSPIQSLFKFDDFPLITPNET
jgi:hypothetical protein